MDGFNWNTREWNFGYVKENSTLEFNFEYLKPNCIITSVTTSCGCTATMRNRNRLTAELHTKRIVNDDKKVINTTLDVVTSDGLSHKLALKAIVTK